MTMADTIGTSLEEEETAWWQSDNVNVMKFLLFLGVYVTLYQQNMPLLYRPTPPIFTCSNYFYVVHPSTLTCVVICILQNVFKKKKSAPPQLLE